METFEPARLDAYFARIAGQFTPEEQAASFLITHLLPERPAFVQAVAAMTRLTAVLPKPKSIHPAAKREVEQTVPVDTLTRDLFAEADDALDYLESRAAGETICRRIGPPAIPDTAGGRPLAPGLPAPGWRPRCATPWEETDMPDEVYLLFADEPYVPPHGLREVNCTVVAAVFLLTAARGPARRGPCPPPAARRARCGGARAAARCRLYGLAGRKTGVAPSMVPRGPPCFSAGADGQARVSKLPSRMLLRKAVHDGFPKTRAGPLSLESRTATAEVVSAASMQLPSAPLL
ncbi:hypothetical protein GCM10010277_84640 [Streptomyces longisporoflavus]|nr:hypothetical protein GCM10010277_84640 [Streptomyces longisporoflavus]